jgi:hypothetical protein
MGLRISIDEKLLSEDLTVKRYPVPNGDFVLIGRKSDPADVIGEDIVTRHSDRSRPSRCRSFCGATAPGRILPIGGCRRKEIAQGRAQKRLQGAGSIG